MSVLQSIAVIASAIVAICGLVTLAYKHWWSPVAKMKKQALKDGKKAIDNGDVSGIFRTFDKIRRKSLVLILVLTLSGCCPPYVNIHLVSPEDCIELKKGEKIVWWKDGQRHEGAPEDGYYINKKSFKYVMESKVE